MAQYGLCGLILYAGLDAYIRLPTFWFIITLAGYCVQNNLQIKVVYL